MKALVQPKARNDAGLAAAVCGGCRAAGCGVVSARHRGCVAGAAGAGTPFAGGLALAYVLDIPARWFAIHLFGGRRGPGILLAYLVLFGTVAALVGLVVPQLVQSVGSFAAALPGYLETRRRCWSWCRQTMGWIPPA